MRVLSAMYGFQPDAYIGCFAPKTQQHFLIETPPKCRRREKVNIFLLSQIFPYPLECSSFTSYLKAIRPLTSLRIIQPEVAYLRTETAQWPATGAQGALDCIGIPTGLRTVLADLSIARILSYLAVFQARPACRMEYVDWQLQAKSLVDIV
jgi:hypothetical protein